jgi:hypothetical protein
MRLDQYDDCEAEYLTTSYSVLNQKEIFILKPRHIILSAYNNINRDLDEWFKTKINKFRKKLIITANHFYMKKTQRKI